MRRIIKPNQNIDLAPISMATKLAAKAKEFPAQDAFINDKSTFLAAQCTRRAGKTNGLAFKFLRTMDKYPKSTCIYLALTEDSAFEIMWPILIEINDLYKLNCTFIESKMTMEHPNGAKLRLYGADMKNFIKRLKGRKSPGIAVDESQDFGGHLESLLNDVLTPMLADYADGWLAITGTPGPIPNGYFFEVTHNKRYGYSNHYWTLYENPYLPDPQGFVDAVVAKREWDQNNPTLLREYKNQWVLDMDSLWIRYSKEKNDYNELPPNVKWNYILGVDIGFKDADALAVLAWSDHCKETYLVEELLTTKQDITSLVEQIEATTKKYNAYKIVIDQGGLGLKIAEEIRRRHGVPVEAADKKLKSENVGVLNDELRLGRFKAKSTSRFAQDSYLIQIDWLKSTPDRIVIKKDPHSDIIDAVLYAHKESYAFTHVPPVTKAYPGTEEWAKQQASGMFEKELEGFTKQQEFTKIENGEWD